MSVESDHLVAMLVLFLVHCHSVKSNNVMFSIGGGIGGIGGLGGLGGVGGVGGLGGIGGNPLSSATGNGIKYFIQFFFSNMF